MKETLDLSPEHFETFLHKATTLVKQQYDQLYEQKGYHEFPQQEVESWFNEPLPKQGSDPVALLDEVKQKVFDTATGSFGQNMYGYVISGGNQVSTVADFLMDTVNQNAAKWHLGPSMLEIEKRVVQWAAEMIGYTTEAGGVMVNGGSGANLMGLTVARNIFFRQYDVNTKGLTALPRYAIYCSKETHNSVDKSIALLGMGTDHIRKITVHEDFTIDISALQIQIERDVKEGIVPFCLIGNAGTVNTGALDDLKTLSQIAKQYKMWFHVDGAYGGLIASLPSFKAKYAGMEEADSVALDFHKWLYQPFEIGCTLVRNWDQLRETYFKAADYLTQTEQRTAKLDINEHYFQLSRSAKAFKVWMSLKAYGFDTIQQMMQKDLDLAKYLEHLVNESDDFELKAGAVLSAVCFRYVGKHTDENKIRELHAKLLPALEKDGRVFITGTKLNDVPVLRACIINHRKKRSSIEYLVNTIREVAESIDR